MIFNLICREFRKVSGMCSLVSWRLGIREISRSECKVVEMGDFAERVTILWHYVLMLGMECRF